MATRAATDPSFGERLTARTLRVGVVGLGFTGMPLARALRDAGFPVSGIDVDPGKVRAAEAGGLAATTRFDAVRGLDAIVICVPTGLSKTRTPDLTEVVAATRDVAARLEPGQLVVLQSTTYPGTTQDVLLPILAERGGEAGRSFFLAYAPERVDPGNTRWGLRNTPKIVSGVTAECAERARLLYETVVDEVVVVSSTTVAETAKLHENAFRAVNIALANELALMCDHLGISAWEVIDAAATKPFGFLPHQPGPGIGGACIPVVPHFLSWRLRELGFASRLIDAAHEINTRMPAHVVAKVAEALNAVARPIKGSRILLLGVAYKAGVGDVRESPSLDVFRELVARGGDVGYCDPHVPEVVVAGERHRSLPWPDAADEDAACVVMLTPHREFLAGDRLRAAGAVAVDARNVVPDRPMLWRI